MASTGARSKSPRGKNGKNGAERSPRAVRRAASLPTPREGNGQRRGQLDALLEFLRTHRGFDFTGYKPTTFERRLEKRMQESGKKNYADYLDLLEVDPAEFGRLFDTLLINVTAFFRDPAAWEYLQQEIIPRIVQSKDKNAPIRAWSAGCSSGEEPCTIAMVLCEALGMDQFRQRVKIYATDVDEEGPRRRGRRSIPSPRSRRSRAPSLQILPEGGRGLHVPSGRASRHHLRAPRPDPGRPHLEARPPGLPQHPDVPERRDPVARPGTVPFRAPAQGIPVPRARRDDAHARAMFQPADLKHRVFSKVQDRARDAALSQVYPSDEDEPRGARPEKKLRSIAFDLGPVAQMMVDREGHLVLANERARVLFGVGANDLGGRSRTSRSPIGPPSCVRRSSRR
jgi:two-component system CheB/CheR fusion protein